MFDRRRKLTAALIIALLLAFVPDVFGCGIPQPIHGQAYWHTEGQPETQFRISGARMELRDGETGELLQTTITNPFGYYSFDPVLPCSAFEVRISHKWYTFTPATKTVLPIDFPNDPAGVEVLFVSIR